MTYNELLIAMLAYLEANPSYKDKPVRNGKDQGYPNITSFWATGANMYVYVGYHQEPSNHPGAIE